jgi:PAS domain S-box-containing protein
MKLRAILLQITFLALLAAVIGGYSHFTSLRDSFLRESEQNAQAQMDRLRAQLATYLLEQLKPVRTLAGLGEITGALDNPQPETLAEANRTLDHFRTTLEVDVCYLMDSEGTTLASSNRDAPDSFVGRNFSFRPYFTEAMEHKAATYMAMGSTSFKRGVYYSYPVGGAPATEGSPASKPNGVVVIKSPLEPIEQKLEQLKDVTALIVDPHGIIFIASDPTLLFKSLSPLGQAEKASIAATRQFGTGPWEWGGITRFEDDTAVDREGVRYLLFEIDVDHFPGWTITLLLPAHYDYWSYIKPLYRQLVLPMMLFILISVLMLYRKASQEVLKRRHAEEALRLKEEQYRTLYFHTPAMLHSIDESRKLVSVSDYWADALGYERDEVIGHRVTEFMTEESRNHAESYVIPAFMRDGVCKDVPYQLKKKNGEIVDVLLSAIAERDSEGNIQRSLSVLVDVTELKRIERSLKNAQEQLQEYSRELEGQVRERTLEVSNLLKYTPALVSLKDINGRYRVVNSRFEEIFDVSAAELRDKTDGELFPPSVAEELIARDREVIEAGHSISNEETIPHQGEPHTYLSVRFPLYDEKGALTGVGSVSTDVTELKQAHEKLRQLSNRIMGSQERERAAISRELHDELGQVLTALKMDAVWLTKRLEGNDEVLGRATAMRDMIDQTIEEVHTIVLRLRPGVLDDLGLIAALEWVTNEFERRTGVPCTFGHDGLPTLDDLASTAVYRITQEALTNVARHSGASRVDVNLQAKGDRLRLTITDDGQGFDQVGEAVRHGIAGIRERASLIGGTIEIRSDEGAGTTVTFTLPLEGFITKDDR